MSPSKPCYGYSCEKKNHLFLFDCESVSRLGSYRRILYMSSHVHGTLISSSEAKICGISGLCFSTRYILKVCLVLLTYRCYGGNQAFLAEIHGCGFVAPHKERWLKGLKRLQKLKLMLKRWVFESHRSRQQRSKHVLTMNHESESELVNQVWVD